MEVRSEAVVATFEVTPDVLKAIVRGRITFAIDTKPYTQASAIAAATLAALRAHLRFQERFGFDIGQVVETTALTLSTAWRPALTRPPT